MTLGLDDLVEPLGRIRELTCRQAATPSWNTKSSLKSVSLTLRSFRSTAPGLGIHRLSTPTERHESQISLERNG
jgi:hypothetical protein